MQLSMSYIVVYTTSPFLWVTVSVYSVAGLRSQSLIGSQDGKSLRSVVSLSGAVLFSDTVFSGITCK